MSQKNNQDILEDVLIAMSEVSDEDVGTERDQLSKEGVNLSKLDEGIKSILSEPKGTIGVKK